jgi:hypothetical protein
MPRIIPIPAFTDNSIRLVCDGAHAALCTPADAHARRRLADAVDAFVVVRERKDGFR